MHNSTILKLWVLDKVRALEHQQNNSTSYEETIKLQGKIEILQEFFEDFNLEEVEDKDIVYHKNV